MKADEHWDTSGSSTNSVQYKYSSVEFKKLDITQDGLYAQFNFLLGRLKTIVDATISAPAQNKALKDLIAQDVWNRYNYILEIAGEGKNGVGGKVIDNGEHRIT